MNIGENTWKKEHSFTAGGMQISTITRKTVWRLLTKLKVELPYDPVISLLGIHPKECKSGYNKGTCTPMCITAVFPIAKLWKQ
jgi:hypothetical protein